MMKEYKMPLLIWVIICQDDCPRISNLTQVPGQLIMVHELLFAVHETALFIFDVIMTENIVVHIVRVVEMVRDA